MSDWPGTPPQGVLGVLGVTESGRGGHVEKGSRGGAWGHWGHWGIWGSHVGYSCGFWGFWGSWGCMGLGAVFRGVMEVPQCQECLMRLGSGWYRKWAGTNLTSAHFWAGPSTIYFRPTSTHFSAVPRGYITTRPMQARCACRHITHAAEFARVLTTFAQPALCEAQCPRVNPPPSGQRTAGSCMQLKRPHRAAIEP